MEISSSPIFANLRPRVRQNHIIHIKKQLNDPGKLKVIKNQELSPHDIIGSSVLSGGFSVVEVSKNLGVSGKEAASLIQKQVGSTIYKGELLAQKTGLFGKKIVISPTDGLIDHIDQEKGEVRLKFIPKNTTITSGVFGIVDEVDQRTGEVWIKTQVTMVFGVVGCGNERSGILTTLTAKGNLVQNLHITSDMTSKIIVAGGLIFNEAVKKAVSIGVNGIICGGIQAQDYITMTGGLSQETKFGIDVGISLLVTEGFGLIPIGDDIFNILGQYEGKFVFINGNSRNLILPTGGPDSILSLRKTSLPIVKVTPTPEINLDKLQSDKRVRIIWPPFMGSQGVVVGVDKATTLLESGITTFMVTIETSTKKIKVPYTNLEIIE